MSTTKADLKRWFREGADEGATHMLVITDTFDWSDYPVYVKPGEDAREIARKYDDVNMQRIMEVYDLRKSWVEQSKERVFNY
jgi:hypothetical protein